MLTWSIKWNEQMNVIYFRNVCPQYQMKVHEATHRNVVTGTWIKHNFHFFPVFCSIHRWNKLHVSE